MEPGQACVEALERRQLLSATAVLNRRGRLTITGDDNPTDVLITVSPNKRTLQVQIDGVIVDPKPASGSPTGVRRNRVRRIAITMGAGNDRVQIGVGDDPATPRIERNRVFIRSVIDGGAGDDYIQGGADADILIGNAGNDTIFGDRKTDLIFGGTGDDQLLGGPGKDLLLGQDGNDRLNGGPGDDALYGMAGNDDLAGAGGRNFLNGAPGDDVLEDRNNNSSAGERGDVNGYVDRLIRFGVPESFRAAAQG